MAHVLDHPVWEALHGSQRAFGRAERAACRFDPTVSPFGALDPAALLAGGRVLEGAWHDLAVLAGAGGSVGIVVPAGEVPEVPEGWSILRLGDGVQMTGEAVEGRPDPAAVPLGAAHVAEMTALIEATRPGPFLPRTVELGGYVGLRVEGRLVAMAGERMRPPGFVEISAVATDPSWRGRGLASSLVRHIVAAVGARGDVPFLHAAESNSRAIDLYRRLGFVERRTVTFVRLAAPASLP